jgi:peptidoglycan hydrolase-like protein with peptidoglycan-binding domain
MDTLQRGSVATPDSARQIALLQSLLNEVGLLGDVDGDFGPGTEAAVRRFQAQSGLVVDGVAGEKTWGKLVVAAPSVFAKITALWLSQADLDSVAGSLGVERAAVKAVYEVEAGGAGFLGPKPKILFEGHVFWHLLKDAGADPAALAAGNGDILYPKWTTKFYRGGLAEYARLDRAIAIDAVAAPKAASWGLFQIMGANHVAAGFPDIQAFVDAMYQSERAHLDAFAAFIGATRFGGKSLRDWLAACDWQMFARGYNGPQFKKNRYDTRLEAAYDRAKRLIG